MKQAVVMVISDSDNITLELTDKFSPGTFRNFIKNLPFSVELNVWGEEIYSSESPVDIAEENAKTSVELNDVAYWPSGRAICLFYGPTPIGKKGEITPYSPVNIVGKIPNPDKSILKSIEGKKAVFKLNS